MLHREVAGLHVHEAGEGRPVVLLHAFPVDSELYEHQLSGQLEGGRIIAPDLPGFGRSPVRGVRSVDDYADAVVALLDAEQIERCVIGGCSMGGYITFALLRRAPERFEGLVLIDTRPGTDSEEAKRGRYETADAVEKEGTGGLVDGLLPRLLGPRTLEVRPDVVATVRKMGERASAAGAAWALRAMADRPDSGAELGTDLPALVVVGADDAITGPPEAEAMHARLKRSTLRVIEGAGHLTPIEAPEEFNKALGEFLATM